MSFDPSLPKRRRVLRTIKIDEISGVDRPAQEGARVVILKRAPSEDLGARIARLLERSRSQLSKATPETDKHNQEHSMDLTKHDDDYEALIKKEIAGSCMPRHVAEQRLLAKYGPRPNAAQIRKSDSAVCDFMAAVDTVMVARPGLSRTAAMREVRKSQPELYGQFQEV